MIWQVKLVDGKSRPETGKNGETVEGLSLRTKWVW